MDPKVPKKGTVRWQKIGLYFLLHCNFDENFLKSIEMPSFYKQILSFFLELKSIYDMSGDQELILFNNKYKKYK